MGFWIILIFISLASAVKKECPGGNFTCPNSATCCPLTEKSYGCCPMENAVCCDDHIHCCPANTKCAIDMCVQSNNRSVEIHLLRNKDVICDDQSVCSDGTTCCKNPHTQKVGCCPKKSAVCCDDGLHCCPEGTTCNLEERKCDGDGYVTHIYDSHKKSFDTIISNITLASLRSNKESSVICPGGQYQCPDGNTCCNLPNQRYSCCPLSERAVCCMGGLQCCPEGNTCCKLPNQDGYSCCPLVRASCCIDGLHCCPEHFHCDPTSRYCNQGPRNVTSLRQIPAKKIAPTFASVKESSVICPGGQYQCPDGNTCCKVPNQGYRCCPLSVRAVCCTDGLYCCPEHTHCDSTSHQCYQGARNVTSSVRQILAKKIAPTFASVKESRVICPGGQYQCPDGNTCCKVPNQGYRCCPLTVRAVCCTDGLYCCPEHTHCDSTSHQCYQGARNVTSSVRQIPATRTVTNARNVTSLRQIPAKKIAPTFASVKESSVICPGGQYQCPDGNTCCKVPNQGYRCCPLSVRAVCCTDGLYCCPEHTHCDSTSHQCYQGARNVTSSVRHIPATRTVANARNVTSLRQIPAKKIAPTVASVNESSVICPGGQYQCPDGNTCCKVPNQGYRCCPLSVRAVCCTDGLYCCPEHTHCDSTSHQCYQGARNVTSSVRQILATRTVANTRNVTSLRQIPAKKIAPTVASVNESSVICPGGQYQCPDGNTCCNLPNQRYSCCPLSDRAVCCMGGLQCCPEGNTCCKLPNQDGYSCCPLSVSAVCCTDGLYCCPEHTHCDSTSHQCYQGARNVTSSVRHIPATRTVANARNVTSLRQILAKKIAPTVASVNESSVICPGGQYQCPDGNTCCKVPNQGYRCCPLSVRAVCCTDGLYCCPEHTHCDSTSHQCYQGARNVTSSVRQILATRTVANTRNVTSLRQIPTKKIAPTVASVNESSVICPGGQYQCPDGNTCCNLPNQRYSCCPLSVRAVCCMGGLQCCPEGNTCCKLPNQDGYSCCPLSVSAVCCTDGLYCCPEHTHCDSTSHQCYQGARNVTSSVRHIPATRTVANARNVTSLRQIPAKKIAPTVASVNESSVICPGGQYQCPDGNTCCKVPNQGYRCCPLSVRAVCCTDGLYCCPEHTHCDSTSHQCYQGARNVTSSVRHIPATRTVANAKESLF